MPRYEHSAVTYKMSEALGFRDGEGACSVDNDVDLWKKRKGEDS